MIHKPGHSKSAAGISTHLLASRDEGDALIDDPVEEKRIVRSSWAAEEVEGGLPEQFCFKPDTRKRPFLGRIMTR